MPTAEPTPDLRTLATIVAKARAARWRYTETLDPTELENFVRREAGDANLLADLAAVLPALRRLVTPELTLRQLVEQIGYELTATGVLEPAATTPRQDSPGATGEATAVPQATPDTHSGAQGDEPQDTTPSAVWHVTEYRDDCHRDDDGEPDTYWMRGMATSWWSLVHPEGPAFASEAALLAAHPGLTPVAVNNVPALLADLSRVTQERDEARARVAELEAAATEREQDDIERAERADG